MNEFFNTLRAKQGRCLSGLEVASAVKHDGKCRHSFNLTAQQTIFERGEYVIVSTDKRINVSSGYVMDANAFEIVLLIDKYAIFTRPKLILYLCC